MYGVYTVFLAGKIQGAYTVHIYGSGQLYIHLVCKVLVSANQNYIDTYTCLLQLARIPPLLLMLEGLRWSLNEPAPMHMSSG
jgi:hypothetical protein